MDTSPPKIIINMKSVKLLLFMLFVVMAGSLYLPYDVYYLWTRPINYTGNTLAYHHAQLRQQGFSFLTKLDRGYGSYEYLYIRYNMLGRVQYMGIEREYDSNTITGATKYSPSLYSDSVAVCYSRNLSDDFSINKKIFIYSIANDKTEIADNEFFLTLNK